MERRVSPRVFCTQANGGRGRPPLHLLFVMLFAVISLWLCGEIAFSEELRHAIFEHYHLIIDPRALGFFFQQLQRFVEGLV